MKKCNGITIINDLNEKITIAQFSIIDAQNVNINFNNAVNNKFFNSLSEALTCIHKVLKNNGYELRNYANYGTIFYTNDVYFLSELNNSHYGSCAHRYNI